MFDSQVRHKLWLAAAAAGLLTVAGCQNQATNKAAATTKKAETPKAVSVSSKAPQPTTMVTVPKGTAISATVGQTLASNKNHVGDTFAAKLSTPVQVEGKTDRKSTRLNSSHGYISYAVFCLKKKNRSAGI